MSETPSILPQLLAPLRDVGFTTAQVVKILERHPATLLQYVELGLLGVERVRDRHRWDVLSVLRLKLVGPPRKITDKTVSETRSKLAKLGDLT